MIFSKTIQRDVIFYGIGLHTSAKCSLKVSPADAGTGYLFRVRDEEAKVDHITLEGSNLGTNMVCGSSVVRTVEHLLSALVGLGITDVIITTNDVETPILDGSAADFFKELKFAGVRTIGDHKPLRLDKQLTISMGGKMVAIYPRNDNDVVVSFRIDFDNEVVRTMPQELTYSHSEDNYFEQIAFARTFGFKKDLQALLSNNLCLGGSLENAVLIDDNRVINVDGLRFESEIVSHKVLDIIGDLSPVFRDYIGFTLVADQAGHSINNKFLKQFYAE
ncbi:UDP-3-O-acyl-N-acetylglucosamine deacetylase [Vibrio coralliirubri]|uniref:UDP-3-O-acyl-N-acetylglucosamine deacetylase n=1 Tax=Vibrio coralliirubri TaxID=1516159 RepID=UPI0022852B9F|nr:UDP-3-O-acyl-N-acetylglucosamine deacetylase [Vibrio coralliirubri]MCY9860929.1 UDP-3-O-acyl-N-acetylglucosamine deacetylase [Vibrio coralliirubri]